MLLLRSRWVLLALVLLTERISWRFEGSSAAGGTSFLLAQAHAVTASSSTTPRHEEAEIESSGEARTNSDNDDDDDNDTFVLSHFVAHNKTMTCTADEHARPFNNQIRGVNLVSQSILLANVSAALLVVVVELLLLFSDIVFG